MKLVHFLSLALFALPLGCGKPVADAPAKVRGSVTFQNRPMEGGLIVFVPDKDRGCAGKIASAFIQPGGLFEIVETMEPGWYKIALSEPPEWYGSDWERAFPNRLRRPDQSGLSRQVKPGIENVFEFPIELRE